MSTAQIADDHIAKIASNLPHWQVLARKMGFGTQDIDDIDQRRPQAENRIVFLRKWIEKNGTRATYVKLCTALEEIGEHGAADTIHAIAKDK